MFRSCQIIIRELSSLPVFTIQFVFANEVLWQHIMLCGNVLWSSWLGVRRTLGLNVDLITGYPDCDFALFAVDFPGECSDSGLNTIAASLIRAFLMFVTVLLFHKPHLEQRR